MSKFKIILIFICALILTGILFVKPQPKTNKTVIKFTSWGSESEIAILKPILSEFEKENPDIKVELVHIPQNYFQKLQLLFASNLAPDVLFINNLYLPIYANANVLEEITPNDINFKDFYPKSLQTLSYNNKLYAVPRDVSNLVIYYNKDIFDKYKVPYPTKNWTFKDFLSTAQKLTKDTNNDGKIDIFGISFEEDLLFYIPYLMSDGGGVLSDDLKTMIINSKQSQKGLN